MRKDCQLYNWIVQRHYRRKIIKRFLCYFLPGLVLIYPFLRDYLLIISLTEIHLYIIDLPCKYKCLILSLTIILSCTQQKLSQQKKVYEKRKFTVKKMY